MSLMMALLVANIPCMLLWILAAFLLYTGKPFWWVFVIGAYFAAYELKKKQPVEEDEDDTKTSLES